MMWKQMTSISACLFGMLCARDNSCGIDRVPAQLQSAVAKEYAGWRVLMLSDLSSFDRSEWQDHYHKECPGLIKGKFIDSSDSYVLNLIRKQAGRTYQEIVLFRQGELRFEGKVLSPQTAVDRLTVIRRFPAGEYKSVRSGKPIRITVDTIGIAEIGAWTVVYYWDGTLFRSLVTSE